MSKDITKDRWFKLRVDTTIKHLKNVRVGYARYGRIVDPTPWYDQNIDYISISRPLAEGTVYTVEEVAEHLKTLVASAKLEALLDNE